MIATNFGYTFDAGAADDHGGGCLARLYPPGLPGVAAPAGTEWVDLYQLHVGTCPPLRRRRSPARWTSWSPRA